MCAGGREPCGDGDEQPTTNVTAVATLTAETSALRVVLIPALTVPGPRRFPEQARSDRHRADVVFAARTSRPPQPLGYTASRSISTGCTKHASNLPRTAAPHPDRARRLTINDGRSRKTFSTSGGSRRQRDDRHLGGPQSADRLEGAGGMFTSNVRRRRVSVCSAGWLGVHAAKGSGTELRCAYQRRTHDGCRVRSTRLAVPSPCWTSPPMTARPGALLRTLVAQGFLPSVPGGYR